MSQQGQILTLAVRTRNSGHLRPAGVDSGLFAEQIIGNLRVTHPDMHLTTDSGSEDTIVFVAELLHRKPRTHGIDIVDASNIWDGGCWSRHKLEAFGRLVVDALVVGHMD